MVGDKLLPYDVDINDIREAGDKLRHIAHDDKIEVVAVLSKGKHQVVFQLSDEYDKRTDQENLAHDVECIVNMIKTTADTYSVDVFDVLKIINISFIDDATKEQQDKYLGGE